MDLSKFLKGPKEAPEASEGHEGAYDYDSESLKIVKRVVGCSEADAQDLVMALCQLIEDKGGFGGPAVVVKIES